MNVKNDARIDEKKWEVATAFVRAQNDYTKTIKLYGTFSPETREAFLNLTKAMQAYRRWQRK